jgi:phosphoribosylformylglycinamidine (FGAM) synthase PurS component
MVTLEVLVKLAAPDPWSFTVQQALSRKFGLAGIVNVDRVKAWQLTYVMDGEDAALDITKDVLNRTALLANPNRDVWVIKLAGADLPAGFWPSSTEETAAFAIKVTDLEDLVGRSVAEILGYRLGIRQIRSVRFSTIWILQLDRAGRPEELAQEIAVAQSWRRGLLANPHCQRAEIWPAEAYVRGGPK